MNTSSTPLAEPQGSQSESVVTEHDILAVNKKRSHAIKPCDPTGVLAVHVKSMRLERWSMDQMFDSPTISVYLRMRTGDTVKYTCAYDNVAFPSVLFFDDLKHFPLRVSTKRGNPGNVFKMDLMGFDRPDVHLVIGRIELHVYDIIKKMYTVEKFRMKRMDKVFGELDVEFCFSYGLFGYGYSHQLENRQMSPRDQISHSMFTRVAPPLGRNSANVAPDVMMPIPIDHPVFIPFTVKSTIGRESDQPHDSSEQSVEDDPIMLLSKIRKRFHNLQTVFNKKTSRRARITFLEKLILKNDVDDSAEEYRIPPSFKLKHRKAPCQAETKQTEKAGGTTREAHDEFEDEDHYSDAEDNDLGQAERMMSLAPGIRSRSLSVTPDFKPKLRKAPLPTTFEDDFGSPKMDVTPLSSSSTLDSDKLSDGHSKPEAEQVEQPKSIWSRIKSRITPKAPALADIIMRVVGGADPGQTSEGPSEDQPKEQATMSLSEFGLAGSIDPGYAHNESFRTSKTRSEEQSKARRPSVVERMLEKLGGARKHMEEPPPTRAIPRVMVTPATPTDSETDSSEDEDISYDEESD